MILLEAMCLFLIYALLFLYLAVLLALGFLLLREMHIFMAKRWDEFKKTDAYKHTFRGAK